MPVILPEAVAFENLKLPRNRDSSQPRPQIRPLRDKVLLDGVATIGTKWKRRVKEMMRFVRQMEAVVQYLNSNSVDYLSKVFRSMLKKLLDVDVHTFSHV